MLVMLARQLMGAKMDEISVLDEVARLLGWSDLHDICFLKLFFYDFCIQTRWTNQKIVM